MSLAYRLKQLCRENGISLSELLEGMMDNSIIEEIESGNLAYLSEELINIFAERLNVSVAIITGDAQGHLSSQCVVQLKEIRDQLYSNLLSPHQVLKQLDALHAKVSSTYDEQLYLDYLITKGMVMLRTDEWQQIDKIINNINQLNLRAYVEENFRFLRLKSIVAYKRYRLGAAIGYLEEALKLKIDKDDIMIDYALVFYNLALYYQLLSDYNTSSRYLEQAIHLLEKHQAHKSLLADCFLIKGILHLEQRELDQARQTFTDAITCGEQVGNEEIILQANHNLAIVLKELKEDPVPIYQKLLDYKYRSPSQLILTATLYNLCLYLFETKRFDQLDVKMAELEERIEATTDIRLRATAFKLIGRFTLEKGYEELYLAAMKQAIDEFEKIQLWKEAAEIYFELGQVLSQNDYLIKAAEYYKKYFDK